MPATIAHHVGLSGMHKSAKMMEVCVYKSMCTSKSSPSNWRHSLNLMNRSSIYHTINLRENHEGERMMWIFLHEYITTPNRYHNL